MRRSFTFIGCIILFLSGCSWPFGGTFQKVAFTVLEGSGVDFNTALPEASIVNVGAQTVDILITGEALSNGPFPLVVHKVGISRDEIHIFLDWDQSEAIPRQSVHKLIRLEKGEWWTNGEAAIRLFNVNGGSLDPVSDSRKIREAAFEQLPNLTNERVYLTFSFENVGNAQPNGTWDVTVVGTMIEGQEEELDVVAKLKIDDENTDRITGEITYYSPHHGAIVKVKRLGK